MELAGERIKVRAFSREEWHLFWRGFESDPIADARVFVYEQARCDRAYQDSEAKAKTFPRFGIFLPDGTPIGLMELKRLNRARGRCEFGILMQNDTWKNQGYGTEGMRLLLDYAFGELGVRRMYADTFGTNLRMQRLFEKTGFRYMYRNPALIKMPGRMEDQLYYVRVERRQDMRLYDYAWARKLLCPISKLRQTLRKAKQRKKA